MFSLIDAVAVVEVPTAAVVEGVCGTVISVTVCVVVISPVDGNSVIVSAHDAKVATAFTVHAASVVPVVMLLFRLLMFRLLLLLLFLVFLFMVFSVHAFVVVLHVASVIPVLIVAIVFTLPAYSSVVYGILHVVVFVVVYDTFHAAVYHIAQSGVVSAVYDMVNAALLP